ncbi:MAG: T9SS type A sorting domain-containing protein [Flavobacterium sp. JAD_PAG50586_2]|nr:MAG: T9SS type A sorting domain-containing protein [Flavobacterium sp. JAD_PAG50586_2]
MVVLLCLIAFLFPTKSIAQVTLFQFNFENNLNPAIDNVTGIPAITGNGLGTTTYPTTNPCQGARMISVDNWDTGDYIRFTVNTTGFANMGFSFCNKTDATTIGNFIVRVSADGGGNWTTVLATFTPTTANNTLNTVTFPTPANNNSTLLIDIYKTNNANFNTRDYILDSATLTGYRIPTITSVTPASGCPGTTVVITGTNFTNVTAVNFNGIAATSYTIDSATQITATIPNGNTNGAITVTTLGGTATSGTSFTPIPFNTAGAASSAPTVCINNALPAAITHTTTGATGMGISSGLPSGVTASWTTNTITINGTPTVAGIYNYSVPLIGGCGSVNATGTINVNALNTVGTASSTPTVCINSGLTAITHTTTVATGIGPATGLPSGVTASWASNTITISGTPTAAGTFNYSIPLTGGCGGGNATGTITVTDANTVGIPSSSPTLCINTILTDITHTTSGATGIGAITGLPSGVTAAWASDTITISGTPTNAGTFNYSILLTGGCGNLYAEGTITVTSVNTVGTASSSPIICVNTSLTDITHSTTEATGIGSPFGLPTGVTANWASDTITISGTPTDIGTFNYSIPLTGGCGNINATGTIVVEDTVAAAGTILGASTACQGETGVIYSVPAIANATNYIWTLPSGASIASGLNTNSITVDFSATASSGDITVLGTNSCGTGIISVNHPVTVSPLPDTAGIIGGPFTVCQGETGVIYSVPAIANAADYIWNLPNGATIVAGANTNSITVDYSIAALSGNITVQATNECGNGLISANYFITINIAPSITSNYSVTICGNETATVLPIDGGGNVVPPGTTYSWSLPSITGGISGETALSNQSSFVQTLINSTNVQQTASYNVTASTNGCSTSTFSVLVYVNPKPTISGTPLTQSICSGAGISSISLSNPNNISGAIDYSWTRDNTVNITGIGAIGTGATISANLTNALSTPQTTTFTAIATTDNNCISDPFTVTVVVSPTPTAIVSPPNQSICSGAGIAITMSSSNVASPTYSFSGNNANVTNTLAVSGATISGTLTNTTNAVQIVTYTITSTANGCSAVVGTASFTVKPKPNVAGSLLTQTLCGGIAISPITISNPNSVSGTTFSWTRDGILTGMANTGTGATIIGSLNNFTTGNVTENFTLTATADGCSSSTIVQVIVLPKPQLTATPASQTICSVSAISAISTSSTNNLPGASTVSWTRNNASITGIGVVGGPPVTTSPISGTLTNTSTTTQATTFTFSTTASNGCSNTASATVTVYAPLTVPVISASQDVCNFQSPSTFYMSTPVSGGSGTYTYQWQRSARNSGGPWTNVATTSTYTAVTNEFDYRLIVTDSFCTSKTVTSNTVYINVLGIGGILDGASLTNVPNAPVCNGAIPAIGVNITHSFLSSVKFNWFSSNGYITPASGGPVGNSSGGFFPTTSYTFNFTAANNTNVTQTTTITVVPAFTNGLGTCNSNATTMNIQIRPTPVVTATVPNNTICSNTSAGITLTGNIQDVGNTTTFNWSVNNNASITGDNTSGSGSINVGGSYVINNTLINTSTAAQNVTYTITPVSNGCSGTPITVIITVAPDALPGTIASSQSICSGDDPAAFTQTAATGIGTLTYQWQSSSPTNAGPWNNINLATANTYDAGPLTQTTWYRRVVTSTYNGAACSIATGNTVQVLVNSITPGTIGGTQTVCSPSAIPITLTNLSTPTATAAISYQWERSTTDCNTGFSDITINGTSATYIIPAGLTTTTYYRRKDISTTVTPTSKSCFAYTNCVTISVNNVTGGTIGSAQTLCGNNPAVFTEITASTGTGILTYQWQSSTTGCSGWSIIPGATTATYDPPGGLLASTYYQRVTYSTLNSVQCSAASNCILVTINPVTSGTISGNRTVCYGGDPTGFTETVAATGGVGATFTYQWQISTNSSGPWSDISGAVNAAYDAPGPINQTTYFRRIATATLNSVSCSATSTFVTVSVNNVTASVIDGNQNVCNPTDNPNAFTVTVPASGNGTLTYQWQSSTIGCSGPWSDISGATSAVYDSPAVTQTTYFQVRVTSTLNGVGCITFSNCLEIASYGKQWNGSQGTSWNNNLNWTPNGIPDATNCVIIPNVTNKPVISGTNYEAHAYSLSILANAGLEITSNNNLTVTDFVNTHSNANFIIRNNASLIQVNDTAANNGHITYTRTSRPMTRWGYVYWGSPIVENAFSQIPGEFDLKYRWQSGTLTGAWLPLSSIAPAEGFIARVRNIPPFSSGLGSINFTFNGTPRNGIVNVNVDSYDSSTMTSAGNTVLLANPYPSAIDAGAFLTHSNNTELGGALFFWTSITLYSGTGPYNVLDYGTWNLSGGVGTKPSTDTSVTNDLRPDGKITSGQGFFSQVFADGPITFDNSIRVPNFNNQFFKNGNSTTSNESENNRFWLNLYSNNTFRQMMVNYKEGATNGFDRLYDANSLTNNEINLYSIVDDHNLVIQGRGLPFNQNDVVPLGYRITNPGMYSIDIDEVDGLFTDNQTIYLKDKLMGITHNLSDSAYSFNATAGTFNDRFEIVYAPNALGVDNPDSGNVFATISNDIIKIESSEFIQSVKIYDISGKLINVYKLTNTSKQFSDHFNYPNGIYIAEITLENDIVVKKKLIH